jgi:hypothetical protein
MNNKSNIQIYKFIKYNIIEEKLKLMKYILILILIEVSF